EGVLSREHPECVVVFGDTNSTVAGALAAAKLGLSLVHVEAGMRGDDRKAPEEINRVVTDHVSDLLCASTEIARRNLTREGVGRERVVLTGDLSRDITLRTLPTVDVAEVISSLGLSGTPFAVATLHRGANTDSPQRLQG